MIKTFLRCILKCFNKICCKCKKNDDTYKTIISIDEGWDKMLNYDDMFIEIPITKSIEMVTNESDSNILSYESDSDILSYESDSDISSYDSCEE